MIYQNDIRFYAGSKNLIIFSSSIPLSGVLPPRPLPSPIGVEKILCLEYFENLRPILKSNVVAFWCEIFLRKKGQGEEIEILFFQNISAPMGLRRKIVLCKVEVH